MKTRHALLCLFLASFTTLTAQAAGPGRAAAFKGWYEILSSRNAVEADDPAPTPAPAPAKEYFMLDDDSLATIWSRWATGDLPTNLVPIKDEPTILAAFTNRETLFINLEKTATIANNYLAIQSDSQEMELRKNPDNTSDLAVAEKGVITFYKLGPATQNPARRF